MGGGRSGDRAPEPVLPNRRESLLHREDDARPRRALRHRPAVEQAVSVVEIVGLEDRCRVQIPDLLGSQLPHAFDEVFDLAPDLALEPFRKVVEVVSGVRGGAHTPKPRPTSRCPGTAPGARPGGVAVGVSAGRRARPGQP